jgi:LacI family transcriptional regulator
VAGAIEQIAENPAAPQILLAFSGRAGPYEEQAIEGILDYVRAHAPWKFRLTSFGGFDPAFFAVDASGIDGAIFGAAEASTELERWITEIARLGAPRVRVTDLLQEWAEPVVMPDNVAVGRAVAQHFIERGFKHLAFCGFADEFSRLREQGFAEAAAGHAVYHSFDRPNAELDWNSFASAVHLPLQRWLLDMPKPVGVMACADWFAYHVSLCCDRAGLKVPEQVALVGADNSILVREVHTPPLSSIGLNGRGGGYMAAKMLDQMMRGESPAKRVVLVPPGPLFVRRSSDVTAVADEDVVMAMRYIAENFMRPITRDQIEQHLCLARRTLQMKFQRLLGRTIQEEIARLRINKAKELLERTNLPIKHIAEKAGFEDVSYFSRAFRRATGRSAIAFRAGSRHHFL